MGKIYKTVHNNLKRHFERDDNEKIILFFNKRNCVTCDMIEDILGISENLKDYKIIIIKENTPQETANMKTFWGIRYLPSIVFMENFKIIYQLDGCANKVDELEKYIASLGNKEDLGECQD